MPQQPVLILFDDDTARRWEPFALTRPVGELLFGAVTFRARAERVFGLRCAAHLSVEHLVGFEEEGAPPVRSYTDAPADGDRLFLLSRAVPAWAAGEAWSARPDRPGIVEVGGEPVGWYATEGSPPPPESFLRNPKAGTGLTNGGRPIALPGRVLERVWELVSGNPDQLAEDIGALFPAPAAADVPAGVHRLGDGALILGEGAQIEPGVVLDTRPGPIWLDRDARVRSFTRLAGPAYIGPGSVVLGGPLEAISVGPVCKVRGELAESVCLGYTNKQHDGHIGHAYLGRWVNLGAETTNSDLKNNYGTIRIWTPDGETDTGVIKLGSLLGDHVKTGIGLLLNTGTVVGAGSNLFGAAMPPKHVPPFSWGTGSELTEYRADKFLEVAERAMGRRDVALSEGMRGVLQRAWTRARGEA
jgi:UDP-N-acetylglucosamine diphosphorylase / glucose-1-phosphate thymidylyltransferase / UDP-N-acetylgalactosamine diphosphorylase / glucosamine-1-phosphate N-acetyltransferase / galactosamine-1-phosphate N-acetyltransferase